MKKTAVLACLALPAIALLCFSSSGDASQRSRPEEIAIDECRIAIMEIYQRRVGADQAGTLRFVEPGVGKLVTAEQTVAQLRDDLVRARLKRADARANNMIEEMYARKAHEVAQADYENAVAANSDVPNTYSPKEIDHMRLEAEKTELQIQKAEEDRRIAGLERDEIQTELMMYQVKAPIDGVVTELFKKAGETVRQGDDIMEITSTAWVRAIGRVSTRDQHRVNIGDRVAVRMVPEPGERLPYQDIWFEGKITFLSPKVSPSAQSFEIYADIKNQEANGNFILKEGVATEMRILVGSAVAADNRAPAR